MTKARKVKLGAVLERGTQAHSGRWTTYRILIGREQHGRITISERGDIYDGTLSLTAHESDIARALARDAFRAEGK